MSVQISAVSARILTPTKTSHRSVQVTVDSEHLAEQEFDKGNAFAQCRFQPSYSLRNGLNLKIQVTKRRHLFSKEVLFETTFTTQDAERVLAAENASELTDHLLTADRTFEIRLSFSMSQSAPEGLIQAAFDISNDLKSTLERLGDGRQFLDTLLRFGVAASELHPIAKAIVGCVNQVYQLLQAQEQCDNNIRSLVTEMADSLRFVSDVQQFAKQSQLKEALKEVGPLVEDTANFVQRYSSQARQSKVLCLTISEVTTKGLADLTCRFDSFKRKFDRGLAVQSGSMLKEILEKFLDNSAARQDDAILERLRPFSKSQVELETCMPDTRADILQSIDDWMDDMDTPNIFWLHGHPGTGKTTISATVRAHLLKRDRLGSSFFFRREWVSWQTASSLWCSIAYDIAQRYPDFRRAVVESLRDAKIDPNVTNYNELFDIFIKVPLSTSAEWNLPQGRLPVVVIDALDECGGFDNRVEYQKKVLNTLKAWQSLPRSFKLLVTSRDEGNIGSVLGAGENQCCVLEVGRNVTEQSSDDILTYLKRSFDEVADECEWISRPWPTEPELEELKNAAAGLFIWARTVVKLVRDSEPMDMLKEVLEIVRNRKGITGLGELYASILVSNFRSARDISLFRKIAGAVIVAKIPISGDDLAKLMPSIGEKDIKFICKCLKSVLDITSSHGLRFTHQSFVDFLVDLSSDSPCPEEFRCNMGNHEQELASACFTAMTLELHFNMGDIESSYQCNKDIPGLSQKIANHVSYSCYYWASHLEKVKYEDASRQNVLRLLTSQLLFWLEVLSIKGAIGIASSSLDKLISWASAKDNAIEKMARGSLSFIRAFAVPISRAAPHIYLSALAFSPQETFVHNQYSNQFPNLWHPRNMPNNTSQVLQGILRGHNNSVKSVAFSADGRRIVSGSEDRTIRLWDAEAQQPIGEPLRAHNNIVTSVAFSADGRHILSGSEDKTICLWDAETQQPIGKPLHSHHSSVTSVAFSVDGQRIVSGCDRRIIHLWDAKTQQLIGEPLRGHDKPVTTVAFSADGRQIVSGSNDKTIRFWDAETQQPIGEPLLGHGDCVKSVAFSADGRRVVSGSSDQTLRLWDARTQQPIGEPLCGHTSWVVSVAFSADGRHIVSGSWDQTIRVWDAETQQPIGEPFCGHDGFVTSVAFSADGRRIVSGSKDRTIRLWDAEARQPIGEPLQHDEPGTPIAFSADGRRFVSASHGHIIFLWDAETRQPTGKPLRGHNNLVTSIAFSADGRHIVSGSRDQTIRVWDAETQEPIGRPLNGHCGSVTSVAFSADGRRIVSDSHDQNIRLWDAETQQQIGKLLCGHDSVTAIALSVDGRRVVFGSADHAIRLWDADTQQPIGEPLCGHNGWVTSVAFSQDGRQIVSCSLDQTICLWDAETQQPIGEPLRGHKDSVSCVAFSPDGRHIVSGSWDQTIRVWDVETQQPIGGPLCGHHDWVTSVAFLADGRHIVSASRDLTVNLWNAEIQLIGKPSIGLNTSDHFDQVVLYKGELLSPDIIFQDDGWFTGPHGELLFWVPAHHFWCIQRPSLVHIFGTPMITFDDPKFYHGKEWTKCVSGPTSVHF